MCNEAVRREPEALEYVPDHLITKEMCNEAVRREPETIDYVPDHFITQEMCEGAMRNNPALFFLVPDDIKTQGMCEGVVEEDPSSLQFVPNWFVLREGVDIWYDDYYDDDGDHWDDNDNEDKFIKWCDGYEKRKAQKAKIKEELLPIT